MSGEAGSDFKTPTPLVNRVLTGIFSGEQRRLIDLYHGRRNSGYARGVSLVAILERQAGPTKAAQRPMHVGRDDHGPKPDHTLHPNETAANKSSASIPSGSVDPGTEIIHDPVPDT